MGVVWIWGVNRVSEKGMEETVRRCAVLPPGSGLGNEVRIILAELEGPEGPAWESIGDRWFRESIMSSARKGFEEGWGGEEVEMEGEGGGDVDDGGGRRREERLHPQFLLQPRIWIKRKDGKVDVVPLIRSREDAMRKGMDAALEGQKKKMLEKMDQLEKRNGGEDKGGIGQYERRSGLESRGKRSLGKEPYLLGGGEGSRRRRSMYYEEDDDGNRDSFTDNDPYALATIDSKPVDFERMSDDGDRGYANQFNEGDYSSFDNEYSVSDEDDLEGDSQRRTEAPSQRRAAERARRRRDAWERRSEIRDSRNRD